MLSEGFADRFRKLEMQLRTRQLQEIEAGHTWRWLEEGTGTASKLEDLEILIDDHTGRSILFHHLAIGELLKAGLLGGGSGAGGLEAGELKSSRIRRGCQAEHRLLL